MPEREYQERRRGRSPPRDRYDDHSSSDESIDSYYSRRRPIRRDTTVDNTKNKAEHTHTQSLVLHRPPSPVRTRSRRRRSPSVDSTVVYYPTRNGYVRERREYSLSPDRSRNKGRNRRRSPSPAYSDGSYYSYYDNGREREIGPEQPANTWKRPAQVAAKAAVVEAFRLRKEPGSWLGPKGARVATVALAAAGINHAIDRDEKGSTVKLIESVIGAKIVNRVVNGSRKKLREEY